MPDKDTDEPAGSPLGRAADRIRESAKWLLASFAAVGALLIAGLQISDLGSLDGWRLVGAIAGIVVGVLGVVVAIGFASTVVTKSFVTLHGLAAQSADQEPRKSLDGDKVLLAGMDTVETLKTTYESAAEARLMALKAHYDDPADTNKEAAYKRAANWALALDRVATNVLDRASFISVADQYKAARVGILAGAALSALGIALFAWSANPPDPTPPAAVLEKTPTNAIVSIRKPNAKFTRLLGRNCDLSAVQAVALADVGANFQVASVPTSKCKGVVFVVTPAIGTLSLGKEEAAPAASENG
jgi:hypothetical protein